MLEQIESTDDKSRDRLSIARQALTDAGGGEIVLTTADNQRVSMTITDFAAINGAAWPATSSHTSPGFNLYFQAVFKGFQRTALLNQGVEGRNNERFYH